MEETFKIDEPTQLALNVALHAAKANGNGRCGTEYLLFGIIATSKGEIAELADMFALNTLRVDLGIDLLEETRPREPLFPGAEPTLSQRACRALKTPRLDGGNMTGLFELLHGLLLDDESGACATVRHLGVAIEEMRRLVGYGIQHLSKQQVEDLIADLDRRDGNHVSWWGPKPGQKLKPATAEPFTAVEIASSPTARVELIALGHDAGGIGFSIRTTSLGDWVLPPVFSPEEDLIPGQGARFVDGPDFFLVNVELQDGTKIDNRNAGERFGESKPSHPKLVPLGERRERTKVNDRRVKDLEVVSTDWWIWPVPTITDMKLLVDWPAEAIHGAVQISSTTSTDLKSSSGSIK